ncbi:predicted protein [Streptomyces sp. C]|nr:predicted protein [Streptomyces sp. C]
MPLNAQQLYGPTFTELLAATERTAVHPEMRDSLRPLPRPADRGPRARRQPGPVRPAAHPRETATVRF